MRRGFALISTVLIVLAMIVVGIVFGSRNILFQKKVKDPIVYTKVEEAPIHMQEDTKQQELSVQIGKYSLPPGVHEAQIKKTYQFGDTEYALVLRSSMNVQLGNLPNDVEVSFAGVLIADKDNGVWEKAWKVQDDEITQKNNPYHMWLDEERLILAVVNQNGAGSGEGIMSLVDLYSTPYSEVVGCYYFGNYGQPSTHGDYFEYTEKLSKHEPVEMSGCENWKLIRMR